ncbi:hypothetical protein [Canibacter zhoujuaniae]|uniref:hypothetical protein n=1 Tax=Canibacter zhoujuaniae TaxID=2708343 RepID=UPI00141EA9E8|nr:hypothetical protein [Canibacter zhoujuaniae]
MRSRSFWLIAVTVFLLEFSLIYWGRPAFVMHRDHSAIALPLSVFAQSLVGFASAITLTSQNAWLEIFTARRLGFNRVIQFLMLSGCVGVALLLVAWLLGAQGSLDAFAPLRAALGIMSIAVIATVLMDYWIAASCGIIFIFIPLIINPKSNLLYAVIAFVGADAQYAWWTVGVLFAAAVIVLQTGICCRVKE